MKNMKYRYTGEDTKNTCSIQICSEQHGETDLEMQCKMNLAPLVESLIGPNWSYSFKKSDFFNLHLLMEGGAPRAPPPLAHATEYIGQKVPVTEDLYKLFALVINHTGIPVICGE